MLKIQCPETGMNAEKCNCLKRPGYVRDEPDVGIVQCENCSLVTHSRDLSQSVS